MTSNFRILARELAVEEVEAITGAGIGPDKFEAVTLAIGEGGSGCTTSDESWFTVYDQTEAF